jgi:hypothetical protein
MDLNKQETDAKELSRIDGILASEEEIVPSSGFLAGVMERVEEEARMPALIPFPWKRALPGFVLIAVILVWGAVELVRWGVSEAKGASLSVPHGTFAMGPPMQQAGWVALALGVSLASWLLARLLAGRPGLL